MRLEIMCKIPINFNITCNDNKNLLILHRNQIGWMWDPGLTEDTDDGCEIQGRRSYQDYDFNISTEFEMKVWLGKWYSTSMVHVVDSYIKARFLTLKINHKKWVALLKKHKVVPYLSDIRHLHSTRENHRSTADSNSSP